MSSSLRAKGEGGSEDRRAENGASRRTESRARWAWLSVLVASRVVLMFVGVR